MQHANKQVDVLNCIFIPQVDTCDPVWNRQCRVAVANVTLLRCRHDPSTGTSPTNPRRQLNFASAFLDAGFLYGHSSQRLAALRSFTGGRLRSDAANGVPANGGGLSMDGGGVVPPTQQRLTGDERGNTNPELLAVTGLWLLEHNRQALQLAGANPSWGDSQLFNAARRHVIALYQHVTVSGFLPALLGSALPAYSGYDPGADPHPSAEFAATAGVAASLLATGVALPLTRAGTPHSVGPLLHRDVYFDPWYLDACSTGDLIRGAVYQPLGGGGLSVSGDAQHHFLAERDDAVAQALLRGRDLGVPSFAQARLALGLGPATSMAALSTDPRTVASLQAVYGSDVNSVDLLVGALAESPVAPGALLGPTLAGIVREHFLRARSADRFWYEHSSLQDGSGVAYIDASERLEVRGTTYADILRRNIGAEGIPDDVFTAPAPAALDAEMPEVVLPSAVSLAPLPSFSPVPSGGAQPSPVPQAESVMREVTAGPIVMRWLPPQANETDLVMTVSLAGTGWFAWGLGEGMADGDILLLRTTATGQGQVLDTRSTGYAMPFTDASQDASLEASSEMGGVSSITFRRALDTGDADDKAIRRGDTQVPIMLAWDISSDAFSFHGSNRILGRLDLFTPASQVEAGAGFEDLSDDRSAYVNAYLYHGISMVLTWGLLVPSSVFSVRFAKHYPFWMSYHRWAMVGSSTVTVPAASAALIAQATGTIQGRAHALVGIVLVVIMQMQLFVGLLVRHWMKGASEPPMRSYLAARFGHRLAGWGVLLLGLAQSYMGVTLLSPDLRGGYLGLVITVCVVFLLALLYNELLVTVGKVDSGKLLSAVQSCTTSMSVSAVRRRLREGAQWVFMDGVVYDVSNFMRQHPGGAYFLGRMVGADIGSMFRGHNRPDDRVKPHAHSARAHRLLSKLAVGILRTDTDLRQSWVEASDRGVDKWTLQDSRQVSFGSESVHRLVFQAPRGNSVPADQWSLTGMGLHMMVAIPGPTEAEGGPIEWLLQRTRLRRPASSQAELWHGAARSYSIVREDAGDNLVLYIKAYRMGLVSPHLCRLRLGDAVQMEGPQGLGMLDHDATGVVVAVCQGTCIATVFDLITHIVARHRVLRAAQAAARRQAAQSAQLARNGTVGSEMVNSSFLMGGDGGIAFNLRHSFGLGGNSTMESPSHHQQLHAGGALRGIPASPMPSLSEDTLTWAPSVSEVGTGTQLHGGSSVSGGHYSSAASRHRSVDGLSLLEDDQSLASARTGGATETIPVTQQLGPGGAVLSAADGARSSSVNQSMRPIALPLAASDEAPPQYGLPLAPLDLHGHAMTKQGTIEYPVLLDDSHPVASPAPLVDVHTPYGGRHEEDRGGARGGRSSSGGETSDSSSSPCQVRPGRRHSAHDGASGGIALSPIRGGPPAVTPGVVTGVVTRRRSESAPKPLRSVLRNPSISPRAEPSLGPVPESPGSTASSKSSQGQPRGGGKTRRSVSFSDAEMDGPDASDAAAAAQPSNLRGPPKRYASVGRESTNESVRELRSSSDVDATLRPGGWDADRKGRPKVGTSPLSPEHRSVPGLPKRPAMPRHGTSAINGKDTGRGGIFSRLVGRARVGAMSNAPLPLGEEASDDEVGDVFARSGTLDEGGGNEVPRPEDIVFAADAVVWLDGADDESGGHGGGTAQKPLPASGGRRTTTSSGGSAPLPSAGSGRKKTSPTPLVRRAVVRQDSAGTEVTGGGEGVSNTSGPATSTSGSGEALIVSTTHKRRGSVTLSEVGSVTSHPSSVQMQNMLAARGNTLSSVETATGSYQKQREAEQQAERLNKPLRLVLLGVFRDTSDVFELEWLLRMQAECPNIAVRFLVKNDPPPAPPRSPPAEASYTAQRMRSDVFAYSTASGRRPSMSSADVARVAAQRNAALLREVQLKGQLSPRMLRKLLPGKDLHSVVVCGSHAFKSSVTSIYRKVGVPLSSISTL